MVPATSGQKVERPVLEVTDAEVDKTIEVLRKQRTSLRRPRCSKGDRMAIDSPGARMANCSADRARTSFVIGAGHAQISRTRWSV